MARTKGRRRRGGRRRERGGLIATIRVKLWVVTNNDQSNGRRGSHTSHDRGVLGARLGAYGSHNGRWGEYQGGFARGAADENTITEQVSDHAPGGVNGQPQLGQLGSRSPLLLLDASVFASRFLLPLRRDPCFAPEERRRFGRRRPGGLRLVGSKSRGSVAAWQRGGRGTRKREGASGRGARVRAGARQADRVVPGRGSRCLTQPNQQTRGGRGGREQVGRHAMHEPLSIGYSLNAIALLQRKQLAVIGSLKDAKGQGADSRDVWTLAGPSPLTR